MTPLTPGHHSHSQDKAVHEYRPDAALERDLSVISKLTKRAAWDKSENLKKVLIS